MIVMTTSSAAANDPRGLLSDSRALARGVRRAQRATWFPLLVLAAVTFLAILIQPIGSDIRTCKIFQVANGNGRVCVLEPKAVFIYWPIALVLAYIAIAAFYIRRSEERGVGSTIRPYVIAGIVLTIVLSAVSLWAAYHPAAGNESFAGIHLSINNHMRLQRVASPGAAIGLGLIVLTYVERSKALAAVAIAYLIVVITPVTFGLYSANHRSSRPPVLGHPSHWEGTPQLLLHGAILLLAGIGFAIAQRSDATVTA